MFTGPRHASRLVLLATFVGGGSLLSGGMNPAVAKATDVSSDIPGIELPGPTTAGRLGGAIYDVVYRLTVAPGYVIAASLTGAPETDFDLYLFDSTATTVLADTGLLRKSIGPTSTEAISWPSRSGGTYYIDLNGATDVEGDYRLTVQTVPDPTPPVVSVVLAGGRAATNQLSVPVALTASDDLSGVTEMAFSSDGFAYSDWAPFARSTTWVFAAGDGLRSLWVKVMNGVGVESAPARANVTIDTIPPTALAIKPPPGASVASLRPVFSVTFSERMDPASWIDMGLIVQSAFGDLVSGTYSYDPGSRTGTFVPTSPLAPGGAYLVTIAKALDLAGNQATSFGSWTIIPLAPSTLAARPVLATVVSGASVHFDVSLTGAPMPATVQVLAGQDASGSFTSLPPIDLASRTAVLDVTPDRNTTYRFSYAGTSSVAPATLDVPILVRRSVTLAGRDSSATARSRVGSSVKLVATVGPAGPGVAVSFRLYRYDTSRRRWVYAGSHGRNIDTGGHASYTWTPAAAGSYYWRASVASTTEFANNVSPVYRWTVSR